jgi:hypothetical protein
MHQDRTVTVDMQFGNGACCWGNNNNRLTDSSCGEYQEIGAGMKDEFVVERRFQQKATKPKNYSGFKSK